MADSMKMKLFLLALMCGLGTGSLQAQEGCRIVFYNVENLFDTCDDPVTEDQEFTPRGTKHWTKARYIAKLRRIAEVLGGMGDKALPAVIGLAEVENRRVLADLCEKTALAAGRYGIVHQDSPDRRGIDVALLYRQDLFRLLKADFLRLTFPEDTAVRTRDLLYAAGRLDTDTVHFFVCHFPSMLGGEKQSEWKRKRAAACLRSKVDSLFEKDAWAKVVIMGDMNGEAHTAAQQVLGTRPSDKGREPKTLYNTGYYLLKKNYGSFRYQGRWQTIDHIIVSGGLFGVPAGWQAERRLRVYRAPFLLEKDPAHFGYKPFPTYRGPRYIGGYSDHLPVYLDLFRVSDKPVLPR